MHTLVHETLHFMVGSWILAIIYSFLFVTLLSLVSSNISCLAYSGVGSEKRIFYANLTFLIPNTIHWIFTNTIYPHPFRCLDHGVALTTDTDKFIIGQHVWVGGHRPGQIAFIGETHFAPGDWAGIVLDDASGKNDGCVSGKRYFQCEPKRGIFSKLTRLTLEPISGAGSPHDSTDASMRSFTSPARSSTGSPTHSVRSYVGKSPAS